MRRIYALFLCLYPREYRDLFGAEVLDVFAEAAAEQRRQGLGQWVRFLIAELFDALVSAARHWLDRSKRELPVTPLERMKASIARRDFLAARAWSIEDFRSRQ